MRRPRLPLVFRRFALAGASGEGPPVVVPPVETWHVIAADGAKATTTGGDRITFTHEG